MGKKSIMNFRYLRENYREILREYGRTLGERFPEAAVLNLLILIYQGGMLWAYTVEEFEEDWLIWTARLSVLLLVAVAAELWRERRPEWSPGRYRWKIACLLAVWLIVYEAGRNFFQGFEEAMFYLATPLVWSCLIFYLLLPQAKERQSRQLRSCVSALVSAGGIGMLLSLLVGICLAAVQVLLVEVPTEVDIFLLGVVPFACAVSIALCLLPRAEVATEPAEPILNRIVMGLVLPCYVFLLVILYLYIGKIIWQQSMPVGEMNWYASLALLGYGFFYFFWNDMSKNWFDRFMKWGLVWFLPILLVQLYGVWIRYAAYGLTTLRYLSMLCTGFGVLFLAFRFLRQGIRPLFLVAAVLVAVFSLSPLNVMRVPLHEQQARLIDLLTQEGLYAEGRITMSHPVSPERAQAVKSCVDYICSSGADEREDFCHQVKEIEWKQYLPKETVTKKSSGMELPPKEKEDRVSFFPSRKGIPLAGYQWAYPVNIKKAVVVIPLEEGERREVDLTDYAARLVAAQSDVPWQAGKFKNCREKRVILDEGYVLDDRSLLYFSELTVILGEDGQMKRINGRGYLLLK